MPAASAVNGEGRQISRREFLYYLWGASAVLVGAGAVGAGVWFALPHLRYGIESGVFKIDPKLIPDIGSIPNYVPDGQFWLSNTEQGLLALSAICAREGCHIRWLAYDYNHFVCPCCASRFSATG